LNTTNAIAFSRVCRSGLLFLYRDPDVSRLATFFNAAPRLAFHASAPIKTPKEIDLTYHSPVTDLGGFMAGSTS
jgi:hypothetical protein